MDYTQSPLTFKVRKTLRYARLYGPRRTTVKAQSYYHMRRSYETLPTLRDAGSPSSRHVGIIGCGKFAFAQIAYFLTKSQGGAVRGVMDLEVSRAASLGERYGCDYFTADADRVIEDERIDLVYIASNHASHAEYAIRALEAGKAVHIEKPHVVTMEQLRRLCDAMERYSGRVRLGFNRPESKIGRAIQHAIGGQRGPAMVSWFVAGHEIPADHWYYAEEEGGRILGNLCHWSDLSLRLIDEGDRYPILVTPTRGLQADSDIAVTLRFGDGSIAAITFSAKGHTFEGVREWFAAHRGDVLVRMEDFHRGVIETGPNRRRIGQPFHDHGHSEAINSSYAMTPRGGGHPGQSIEYVWNTGELFLEIKRSFEDERQLEVGGWLARTAVRP